VVTGKDAIPLDHLRSDILNSLEVFTMGAGQADDITLLLLRLRPNGVEA
jgi:hypothetical protein